MFSHNVGGMTQLHDLYQLVSGPWLKTHVIPDDRGVDGTFHKLRDEAEELSHKIVEEDTGRAGTLYNSYMEIGRASCRERVEREEGGVGVEKRSVRSSDE